ncbi:MAG TPA: hypothetical protein VNN07_19190 [Candidatus Tectomicrobia bacterium]|nr:hypothetical protein [Candidatus Tectomicrobia bacterium]
MRLRVQIPAPTIHIPLRRLALCLDCEECFEIGQDECPACGSQTWSTLSRFIGDSSEKAVVRALHALVDETGAAEGGGARHLLIVSRDQPKLFQMLQRELSGNPTVTVIQDRRTKASGNGRREQRWRNVDSQLRALGWAIVRADTPRTRS